MGEALRFLRHGVGSQQGLRRVPGPAERTLARLVGVFRSILAQLIFEGFAQEVARSVQAFRNRTSERLFGRDQSHGGSVAIARRRCHTHGKTEVSGRSPSANLAGKKQTRLTELYL